MQLTSRDLQILRDLALSHVLSRDQLLDLGYFTTVTRVNTRLRELIGAGLVKRLSTPFFTQSLFVASSAAVEVVGERVAPLLAGRSGSPRFLQHSLSVTSARIVLLKRGASAWRFEQQLRTSFSVGGKLMEVRPDGVAVFPEKGLLAVEVDLGHVNQVCREASFLRGFYRNERVRAGLGRAIVSTLDPHHGKAPSQPSGPISRRRFSPNP